MIISCRDEVLLDDLRVFGTIGDFYRPTNLHKLKPSPYAFVRYYYQEDADNAKKFMNGKQYGDRILSVFDANKQDSYFTQDTGDFLAFDDNSNILKCCIRFHNKRSI